MNKPSWIKVGEVRKIGLIPFYREYYSTYAVFERIKSNGSRQYKEVLVASDSYDFPKINYQA